MARVSQPRIGSFQFNDDSSVTLTNRPLTHTITTLENEGTARTIEPTDTYSFTEQYFTDILTLLDNRLRSDPGAIELDPSEVDEKSGAIDEACREKNGGHDPTPHAVSPLYQEGTSERALRASAHRPACQQHLR